MQLHVLRNIRALVTSEQLSIKGNQIPIVIEIVNEVNAEEQTILREQQAQAELDKLPKPE